MAVKDCCEEYSVRRSTRVPARQGKDEEEWWFPEAIEAKDGGEEYVGKKMPCVRPDSSAGEVR
jgi:hypothetical protein